MQFRTVPKTGDRLSILGFGCMRLALKDGAIDEDRATRQLRTAIDRGVNYVDTAVPYHNGASEPFVGRALGGGYRDKVRLATKLPHWSADSAKDMDRLLAAQLANLQTDRIDYYLVHNLSRPTWERARDLGVLDFLARAKKDGRIRNAGFSYHGDKDTFPTIVDAYDWDFCQIQYNYLDENSQAGTAGLEHAAAKRLAVIIMEPLRGGNLGKEPPASIRTIWDEAPVKRSPAEWALRWIWNHPAVTVVLSGMNEEAHIEENLRIAGEAAPRSLTAQELQLVGRVRDEFRRLMHCGCTGCQYCMPCPSGVDIPTCFEILNSQHVFGNPEMARMVYLIRAGGVFGKPGIASLCTECGACEKKCPQSLPIRRLLKDVAREYDGPRLTMKVYGIKAFLRVQKWWTLFKSKWNRKTSRRKPLEK